MGTSEIVFILFIALLLFGSDKIPDIARGLGKGMRQIKDATNEIKNEINKGADDAGLNDIVKDVQDEVNKAKEKIDPFGTIKRDN